MTGSPGPDPGRARTIDEFITQLRLLKLHAGNPSLSEITARVHRAWQEAGRPRNEWPVRSTVAYCFQTGRRRPNPDLLLAIVHALAPDASTVERWRRALRVVLGESEAASYVEVSNRLPDDLPDFTGRNELLAQAGKLLAEPDAAGPVVITTLEGMAGVGKTALAVHLGHRLIATGGAPGPVLWVNLRGFDPAGPPAEPYSVIESFLRLLGVPGAQIPAAPERREALYQAKLAGSRALIVLDNAASTQQIHPLLAADPGCITLVTSRARLHNLPRATVLPLPPLHEDESLDLLRRLAGPGRVDDDPATAARVAELLGHLPLALTVVGRHLRANPDWLLSDYPPALTGLAMEGGVRAALALSDGALPDGAGGLLRLLAVHPGAEIDGYAAAALAGQDLDRTSQQLDTLSAAHLLQPRGDGRYGWHDLIRAYAAERSALDLPASRTAAALTRLLDYYRHAAFIAMSRLHLGDPYAQPMPVSPDIAVPALHDSEAARAWLGIEQGNLLTAARHAADNGRPGHAVEILNIIGRYLSTTGQYPQMLGLYGQVARIARENRDPAGEWQALSHLATAQRRFGNYDSALRHMRRALAVARRAGDRVGELAAQSGLGLVFESMDRYESAIMANQAALTIAREIGYAASESRTLGNLGVVYGRLGRYSEALRMFQQDLAIARRLGLAQREGITGNNIGIVLRHLGRLEESLEHHQRSLASARVHGPRTSECTALVELGVVFGLLGRHTEAMTHYREAIALTRRIGDREHLLEALNGSGETARRLGDPQEASALHREALALAQELGNADHESRARAGLGS